MTVRRFQSVYDTAVLHKGSVAAVESSLPQVLAPSQLRTFSNSEYLSAMSRRIFRAGLKHAMVDAKWPAFHKAFHDFDPLCVAMMSDEDCVLIPPANIKAVRTCLSVLKKLQQINAFA